MFKKIKTGYVYISINEYYDKCILNRGKDNKWLLKIYKDNDLLLMLRFPNDMSDADALKRASEYLNNYIPDDDDEFTS
jgi:hypothetical protein